MIDTGPEEWVREAIASQEEHIKRSRPCRGVVGTPHFWSEHMNARTKVSFEACTVCGVTRTPEGYAARLTR